MYSGSEKEGNYIDEWMGKTTTFLDCAFLLSKIVWWPSSRCQNTRCLEENTTIGIHLCNNGFGQTTRCGTFTASQVPES
jgi:hypothetical protein